MQIASVGGDILPIVGCGSLEFSWAVEQRSARLRIGLQLECICVKFPIRHMVVAFISVYSSLEGALRIFRAPDLNCMLQAFEWMPVRAEEMLEKSDAVLGIWIGMNEMTCSRTSLEGTFYF